MDVSSTYIHKTKYGVACIHKQAYPISYWRQQASLKSVTGDNSLCTGVPARMRRCTKIYCKVYTWYSQL